jgi:5-methylcytosine-specific restriction endonuclease McrA
MVFTWMAFAWANVNVLVQAEVEEKFSSQVKNVERSFDDHELELIEKGFIFFPPREIIKPSEKKNLPETNKIEQSQLKKEIKEDREQRCFVEIVRKYQKRNGGIIDKSVKTTFNWNDIVEIYGYDTICYLSGEPINLLKRNYNFDHKVPVSRGGDNSLDNLGITHEVVNRMKTDLTPEELMEWCKKILEFNGYKVMK